MLMYKVKKSKVDRSQHRESNLRTRDYYSDMLPLRRHAYVVWHIYLLI